MDILEGIKTRHSTRKFKSNPVPKELIEAVIDAGRRAPTGGNLQQIHFIVITNQDILKNLVTIVQEEYGKMPVTEHMPAYMKNIIEMSAQGKFVFNYNAPVLVVVAHKPVLANNFADSAVAMENMMLACNALDLGSCWVNQIRHLQDNERLVNQLRELGLGADEKVYASLAVGYPDLPNGLNRRVLEIKGNPVTWID